MMSPITSKAAEFLVLAALVATGCVLLAPPSNGHTAEKARDTVKLPDLFNFTRFQEHFAKSYSSQLEAVTRKVYYLANAFKVYVAGLAYRHRRLSHYLALNHMSDWSPQERDMMINKALAGEDSTGQSSLGIPVTEREVDNPEVLARELEISIKQKLAEGQMKHELDGDDRDQVDDSNSRAKRARRQKRSAEKRRHRKGPRKLSADMLIKSNKAEPESSYVQAKLAHKPQSNNKFHDPLAVTPWSRGLIDQQEELKYWKLKVKEPAVSNTRDPERNNEEASQGGNRLGQLREYLSGWLSSFLIIDKPLAEHKEPEYDAVEEPELPDVMFQDLNESGCLFRPRDQLRCGSCYAFAAIAMAEYLFCKKTGQLYAFSEQYMVDCGKSFVSRINGCRGGTCSASSKFIHNFGLELRDRYPYAASENECPYSEEADLKTTGYVRMALDKIVHVPVKHWSKVLKNSPIFFGIAKSYDFDQYGGGVDSGLDCAKVANHVMVVVGEGREDGQEFWLLRNSYGPNWGLGGHYKLAKSAPERCIESQRGYVWATSDGLDYKLDPRLNVANPGVIRELAYSEKSVASNNN